MTGAEARASTPVTTAEDPYAGLQAFGERDQAYFFGRDQEVEELLRRTRRSTATVLFGASGLGKTSLLQAGLFPRLRGHLFLPVLVRLRYEDAGAQDLMTQVRARVAEEIALHGIDAPAPTADSTPWEYFHATRFWNPRSRLMTPVLVFDQFEEIFTVGRDDPRTARFLDELGELVENRIPESVRGRVAAGEELAFSFDAPRFRVIVSLREDFLAQLEEMARSIPSLVANRFRLLRMDGAQAMEAVMKPARAAGLAEASVAEEIVRFVAGESDEEEGRAATESAPLSSLGVEPALLSLVCRELNMARRAGGQAQITSDLVAQAGTRIISGFYERSTEDVESGLRTFIEEQLITPSGFRTAAPLESATALGIGADSIRRLEDRRVLRVEERMDIPHVELIHDRLVPYVRESRDRRRRREAARRLRAKALLAGAGLTLLALGIGSILVLLVRSQSQEDEIRARSRVLTAASVEDPLDAALVLLEAGDGVERLDPLLVARTALGVLSANPPFAVLRGHTGEVRDVAFSPDGAWLATASTDSTARLWPLENPGAPRVLVGHNGPVGRVRFDPADGSHLATSSLDGTVRVWSVDDGQAESVQLVADTAAGPTSSVAFHPSGSTVVASSVGGLIWEAAVDGSRIDTIGFHGREAWTAEYSPDGAQVVSSSADGTARIWGPEAGAVRELSAGENRRRGPQMVGATFSPDGSRVATASRSGVADLWRSDGTLVRPLVGHRSQVNTVAFSSDGAKIVSASNDSTAIIWDVAGADDIVLKGHQGVVWRATFSPDASRVLTVSDDRTARLWTLSRPREPLVLRGHDAGIRGGAFSPDGRSVATASKDGTVRLWRSDPPVPFRLITSGATVAIPCGPGASVAAGTRDGLVLFWPDPGAEMPDTLGRLDERVTALACAPDGDRVMAAAGSSATEWSRSAPGQARRIFSGHAEPVRHVAYGPDGTSVLTVAYDRGTYLGHVRIWTASDTLILGDSVGFATFSPDGRQVAAAYGNRGFRIWSLDRPQDPLVFEGLDRARTQPRILGGEIVLPSSGGRLGGHRGRVDRVAFSPDGTRILTLSTDETARVWSTGGAGPLLVLDGRADPVEFSDTTIHVLRGEDGRILDAVFSPDGSRVTTTSDEGRVRWWSVDGAGGAGLVGRGRAASVAYSPDGAWAVTAAGDGTVTVMDSDGTGEPVVLRNRVAGAAPTASFTGDGSYVVSVSGGALRVWPVGVRRLMELLRAAANDCLDADERVLYLGEAGDEARARTEDCRARLEDDPS